MTSQTEVPLWVTDMAKKYDLSQQTSVLHTPPKFEHGYTGKASHYKDGSRMSLGVAAASLARPSSGSTKFRNTFGAKAAAGVSPRKVSD
jgi:hypothetical protein